MKVSMDQVTWTISPFRNLSAELLYRILQARQEVFVIEQACIFPEIDGKDPSAVHVVAEQHGAVAGYCRIFGPGVTFKEASIGRVITTKQFRGTGVGRELMRRAIVEATRLYPAAGIRISAQQYLEKFYSSFGFVTASDSYLEDGIPHVDMFREPAAQDERENQLLSQSSDGYGAALKSQGNI
jgi:ElaA protein